MSSLSTTKTYARRVVLASAVFFKFIFHTRERFKSLKFNCHICINFIFREMDENQNLTHKYTDFNEENFKKLLEENEALKLLIIQQKKSSTSFLTGSNSTRAFPTRGPLSSNPEYLDTLETKVRVLEKQNYTLRQRVLLLRNQLAETQKRHTLYDDVKSRVNTGINGKPLKRSKKSSISSERLTKSMTLRSRPKSAPSQTNEDVKLLESRLQKLEAQNDRQSENIGNVF